MKTLTDHFDRIAALYPDKKAVSDEQETLTYGELAQQAKGIGTALARTGAKRRAVSLFLHKTPRCVAAMLGTSYSGNFYVVTDPDMPPERIRMTYETLDPAAVITEPALLETLRQTGFSGQVFLIDEVRCEAPDPALLQEVASQALSTDPLYCLFTSGSTGVPKGTVVTHANVIAYTDWFIHAFHIDSTCIFGSQTPFYFSMSVTDLFGALRTGAELVILPKKFFAFPIRLLQFMEQRQVNIIYWVPSALSIIANADLFRYVRPQTLKTVLFAGEVMPVKQLNYWRSFYPDALFANLFGPTETTDICTYYVVDRPFQETEALPIGRACEGCQVMVIGPDGKECAPGEEGELYVRGPFVAPGYYHAPDKTAAAFVQNPLQQAYPEIVYKTGDIVRTNDRGELIYCGRVDHQIKHFGYRIELGEIEAAAMAVDQVFAAACLFDAAGDRILLLYEGKVPEEDVQTALKDRLPGYMLPAMVKKLAAMPHNQNGKIDRSRLKAEYIG